MSYEYIKRQYAFKPEVGRRVRFIGTDRVGVIKRENKSQSHYVNVLFDDFNHPTPVHPGELEYLEPVS